VRHTTTWAILIYAAVLLQGAIVPSAQIVWPGPLAFTLQIWSPMYLWALVAATAAVLVIAGLLIDRWKSPPATIVRAIARGLLVDALCLMFISFVAWNIGMLRGGVIGD
jgi:uncharacterized membrane protein AbrB (regulator of aidB expression)